MDTDTSKKMMLERVAWFHSPEGQNATTILLDVADTKQLNYKITDAIATALTLAFKAGSRAAIKIFTMENSN